MKVPSLRRILAVDDDEEVLDLIVAIVTTMPAVECESVSGPVEAMQKLEENGFDLVICDILMPELDGVELTRQIRQRFPQTDCIIITGHSDSYSYEDMIEAGASDFILKPFTPGELIAKVNRIARERSMRESLERAKKALEWESNVNASLADLARSLLSSSSFEQVSDLVLEQARLLTGSQFGFVGHIDPQTGYLICPTMTKDVWDLCEVAEKSFVFNRFTGLWGWVLNNRLPLLCNDPHKDNRSGGTPPGHIPVRNFVSVPVIAGEELVGQVALANKSGDYDWQDLKVLERVANVYAVAIERGRHQQDIDSYELHIEELVEERSSDLIIANRQLQESERKARELSDQVLQMLMIMSHDIRGPLVSMGAILKLLLRDTYGKMGDGVKNAVRELMSRTANIVRIAEDCLRKAHNVGSQGGDELEVLDLRQDVIDSVLDELVEDIERNRIRIDNCLGEIPAGQILIKGSKIWLRAIYRNLFGNAIKHGGAGCTIAFGFEDMGSSYRLNVYNTGRQIPEEERSKLFTRFGRVQSSECRPVDGMGVGLFLLRENLRRMGGDLWYEAKPDGSDFVFTIPKTSHEG